MTNLSALYGGNIVSDVAYDESTWDGVTGVAPSKNAARDEFELRAPKATPTFTGLVTLTGGQVKFPATAVPSADSNTLDDYEEGTYTVTVTASTGTLTTYTEEGEYTKIGRSVHVSMYLLLVDIGTASGRLDATLPFTHKATLSPAHGSGREMIAAGKMFSAHCTNGSNLAGIFFYDNSSVIVDTYGLRLSVTYII